MMMSNEIDWSGWTEEYPLWVEFEGIGKGWHSESNAGRYFDKEGKYYEVGIEQRGYAIHRRPEPVPASAQDFSAVADAWDGVGLPPVGAVAAISKSTKYMTITYPHGAEVKIYAHFTDDRGTLLAAFINSAATVGGVAVAEAFEPVLTPAQKELAARIITVAHMKELFKDDGIWGIYDAGYRLPGGEE